MKFLFDLFPVILFFVAFKLADIYVATAVAMAATVLLIGWSLFRRHHVRAMQWASLVVIVVFGGATLVLHDETFIKWKPTVLYAGFSAVLIGGLAFGRNFIKSVLEEEWPLPQPVWDRLCVAWGVFFLFMAALNLWVAYSFSTDTWATFKVFGASALFFVFSIAQGLWLVRHLPDEPENKAP